MRARRTIHLLKSGKRVNLLTRKEKGKTEYSLCRGRVYSPSIEAAIKVAEEHGGFHLAGEYSNPDDPRIGILRKHQRKTEDELLEADTKRGFALYWDEILKSCGSGCHCPDGSRWTRVPDAAQKALMEAAFAKGAAFGHAKARRK